MSKQTAALIIGSVFLIAIITLAGWYVFLAPTQQSSGNEGIINTLFSGFFPQGTETPQQSSGQGRDTQEGETGGETLTSPIRRISSEPVAGFTVFLDAKKVPVVRFIEGATGHTWGASLPTTQKNRITNTTVAKVREALWSQNGSVVIARYSDDDNQTVKSFSGSVVQKKTDAGTDVEGSLDGVFLPNNIQALSFSPTTGRLFYLTEENGGASGITINTDGKSPSKIFSSPLAEWVPQWVTPGVLYLGTKPSAGIFGYLLTINPSNGTETRILGGITGLTTKVNQNNSAILVSSGDASGFNLSVYDVKLKTSQDVPLKTLADKCAWDPIDADSFYCGIPRNPAKTAYPDSWYQGAVSFNDDLWKFNRKTGEVIRVAELPVATGQQIDIDAPQVSPDGVYVVFLNKIDRTLWSVKTDQRAN